MIMAIQCLPSRSVALPLKIGLSFSKLKEGGVAMRDVFVFFFGMTIVAYSVLVGCLGIAVVVLGFVGMVEGLIREVDEENGKT